ncbi:MAG: hypothetical protein U9R56_05440 [candidate division Zixibacteria bacterium]|nr:hypothetical protein [candidate division Zixibacteria bacterium]
MGNNFTREDADRVASVLGTETVTFEKDHYRFRLINAEEKRSLVLQVYPEVTLGMTRGMLIVVYTGNSHLQLHNSTGYVVSEELGEVTFVAETSRRLSGMVIEQGASCSLYSSINRELISSDFAQLGVEVMLSGVALSLAEDILSTDEGNSQD